MNYVYIVRYKQTYEARSAMSMDIFKWDIECTLRERKKVVKSFLVGDDSKVEQVLQLASDFVEKQNFGQKPKLRDLEAAVEQLIRQ